MIIRFNLSHLTRSQQNSLKSILVVIQSENKNENEVVVVEFPSKFMVKVDNGVELLLGWEVEKSSYAGITTPEPLPEPEPEPEPKPEPQAEIDPVEFARKVCDVTKTMSPEQQNIYQKECLVIALKESKDELSKLQKTVCC